MFPYSCVIGIRTSLRYLHSPLFFPNVKYTLDSGERYDTVQTRLYFPR